MRLQDYDTSSRFQATLRESTRISPPESAAEVRELVLDLDHQGLHAVPGQSVGVLAPGQKEFGQDHHFRLYTIADMPEHVHGHTRIRLAVKRCSYVDPYSGERYPGRASNYLCDLSPGDNVTITGPYGLAFEVPVEDDATLILIGAGTGIAPFRAFVKHLYTSRPDFTGKVMLFHGARSGVDALYENDERNDFAQYYDKGTFEAIKALSDRPHWTDDVDWQRALSGHADELKRLLDSTRTFIYVAGLEGIVDRLDSAFSGILGSDDRWRRRKAEMEAGGRWVQLVY